MFIIRALKAEVNSVPKLLARANVYFLKKVIKVKFLLY